MDLTLAARTARSLMDLHGLTGWEFAFDRAKVRAGATHFGTRRITLSRHLTAAHDEPEVRETVLHEIAHALVGPRHGHDEVWRARAVGIGASGARCYTADQPAVAGRWQGRCAAGHVVHRHRRPERLLLCARCRGVTDVERVLDWWLDGRPVGHEQLGPVVAGTLAQLQGAPPTDRSALLRPGALLRVGGGGRHGGTTGRVVRRGRTRYLVEVPGGRLYVPFALAHPLSTASSDRARRSVTKV
ncbi:MULTISPECIES: SprT-like domain-containing protein [unclassified Ornithinimicrobium]|uniref:SprT-like domain-containing protein n=1 Tax=unclassified Ornithinimicrobium TaxID=2615080 RepID=UPI003851ABE0